MHLRLLLPFLPTPFYIHDPPPRSRVGARVWKQNAIHGILLCRCVNSLEDCGVRIVHRSSGTIPCRTRRNRELASVSRKRGERMEYRSRRGGRERRQVQRSGAGATRLEPSTLSDLELPKVNFPRLMRLSHNRIFPIRSVGCAVELFKGLVPCDR